MKTRPPASKAQNQHVLVDYENVRAIDPEVVGRESVFLTIFLGATQKKLDAALVERMLASTGNVQLVRIESAGRNAVDFALAYYLGRETVTDPLASFYIISNDTGYDPMIAHLCSRNIAVARHKEFASLPFLAKSAPGAKSKAAAKKKTVSATSGSMQQVLEHLRRTTFTARPRTRTRLISFLGNFLQAKKLVTPVTEIVDQLCKAGHVIITEKDSVTYQLEPLDSKAPKPDDFRLVPE